MRSEQFGFILQDSLWYSTVTKQDHSQVILQSGADLPVPHKYARLIGTNFVQFETDLVLSKCYMTF